MSAAKSIISARRHLDKRFFLGVGDSSLVKQLARPQKGWIKAIREALGMSGAQLARRIGISQPALFELETSEAAGKIKLETLERAATALNCRLVYALVPNEPLETMVRERSIQIASERLKEVEHTMRLEDQAVDDSEARNQLLDRLVSQLDARRMWD